MKKEAIKFIAVAVIAIFLWNMISNKQDIIDPEPVTVIIPEIEGTTDTIYVKEVITEKVYIKGKTIEVDAGYKKKYEESKDSLEKLNIFLDAIKINEYKETLVDNQEILIKGYAKTRGEIIKFKVDYKIKPRKITYIPEVVFKSPKLSLELGLLVGTPTIFGEDIKIIPQIGIARGDGYGFSYGYDVIGKVHYVGFKKSFKIFN